MREATRGGDRAHSQRGNEFARARRRTGDSGATAISRSTSRRVDVGREALVLGYPLSRILSFFRWFVRQFACRA